MWDAVQLVQTDCRNLSHDLHVIFCHPLSFPQRIEHRVVSYPDSVPGFHLSCLIRHLRGQGVPCDRLLESHRVTPQALDMPGARLPRPVMAALLLSLREQTGRDDLGFEMGMQTDLLRAPLLGQLFLASHTLSESLQRVAPYMPLLTPSFKMSCEHQTGQFMVFLKPVRPMPYEITRLALETFVVSTYRTLHQLLPTHDIPMRAEVSWPAPTHHHRYAALPHFQITYQTDLLGMGARLVLNDSVASTPLPQANELLSKELREACARHLQLLEGLHPWAEWIAHILDVVEDHLPSQAELAGLMGISVRTLSRRLEAEGVHFRELAIQIRHRRACDLLVQTETSVSEIASMLGYTDSANFSRAFKTKEGLPPLLYRKQRYDRSH